MSKKNYNSHLSTLDKKNLLGNFTAFDPNGEFLFNCDSKKANWYVNKKLATWIDDVPGHFKLNFKPNGIGNRKMGKYFTEYIKNQCVICGNGEKLTKHHVVPSCYKKHFPLACKSNDHFDVLLICIDCHERLEESYDKRKKFLHSPHRKILEPEFTKYKTLNSIIKTSQKYLDIVDDDFRKKMVEKAMEIDPSMDSFEKICAAEVYDIGGNLDQQICQRIVNDEKDDIKNFIVSWRKLFLEEGQPKFLPNGWLEDHETHFKF